MRGAAGAGAIPGQNEGSAQAADPVVEESESGKRLGVPRAEGRPVGRRGRCVAQDEAGARVGSLGFILSTMGAH